MEGLGQMENPHEVEQSFLLERIIKNADKCNEAVVEMNHCLKDFAQQNRTVQVTAQLFNNYAAMTEHYLKVTTNIMPNPK